MSKYSAPKRRLLTVIAQDPGVKTAKGKVLMTKVEVPAEKLVAGPRGHRVHIVDFDSSANAFYRPRRADLYEDRYDGVDDLKLLESDPHFHAQNVYAIISSTLLTFESALGRHIGWGFDYGTHQIKVAPHAFSDANAFYSRRDEGIFFGYFPSRNGKRNIFTCLSHDIIVHETTHALLDGLRRQYIRPSSADQAAFHEGYADIIALLSVFQSQDIVKHGLAVIDEEENGTFKLGDVLTAVKKKSFLTGLAQEMGEELHVLKRDSLRRSIDLTPSRKYLKQAAFEEPHSRGEILVAAVMAAFLKVWWNRLLGKIGLSDDLSPRDLKRRVEVWRVVEEGSTAAKHLLTILIRALDYMPPVDIEFGDFLSAVITADSEACPVDNKYHYRRILLDMFSDYGIDPSSTSRNVPGRWEYPKSAFDYGHVHFDPMKWDRESVLRFIWENQTPLKLVKDALTTVESVRPVVRIASDGFVLHEVVVEYFQLLNLRADELHLIGLTPPPEMPDWQSLRLYGGGALIFDEFGQLKFDIANRLNSKSQNDRLARLWERGAFSKKFRSERRFAHMHLGRALDIPTQNKEQW